MTETVLNPVRLGTATLAPLTVDLTETRTPTRVSELTVLNETVNTDYHPQPPVSVAPFDVLPPLTVQAGTGGNSALWTGQGPPETVLGASPGDEYLDTLTGTLYRLV